MAKIGLKEQLKQLRQELAMVHKIFNLMHTTLRLDEMLYIILTAVTAHVGLGFNRAVLFLVNEQEETIQGEMGIGPDTSEEATKIWTGIEKEKPSLEDLANIHRKYSIVENSKFNKLVQDIKIPLSETKGGILASTIHNGKPLHINRKTSSPKEKDPLMRFIKSNEFLSAPLKARDKIIGAIVVDNLYTGNPITDSDIRILTMLADQAGLSVEKSQLYEKTLLKSHTDSLTSLFNHGYFQGTLENLILDAKTNNSQLSLIMLDIDNFKTYNDSFGHQVGDAILVEIANIIKASLRKHELACRYGGEEFAIILPETNKHAAFMISERLRKNIENTKFLSEEFNVELTVSLGVANFPANAQDKSSLIACADNACLKAKRKGKNTTEIFST